MRLSFVVLISIVFLTLPLWAEENSLKKTFFTYQDHGKRDPFWPLVSSTGNVNNYDTDLSVTDMVLEGIMFSANGEAAAIANGKVVKKGEHIGELTVESIGKNLVVFFKGEEKFELKLKKKEE